MKLEIEIHFFNLTTLRVDWETMFNMLSLQMTFFNFLKKNDLFCSLKYTIHEKLYRNFYQRMSYGYG